MQSSAVIQLLMIFKSTININIVKARPVISAYNQSRDIDCLLTSKTKGVALCKIKGVKDMDCDHSVICANGLN